jgi:hypothetical protein
MKIVSINVFQKSNIAFLHLPTYIYFTQNLPTMAQYSFNYFALVNRVTLDDFAVKVESGFTKKEFQFQSIQHFYVANNRNHQVLYITYTDDKGKNKNVQLFATPSEMGFTQLVAEFQSKIPGKSLNHLSEKEAFAILKITNPKLWAPVVAVFIVLIAIAIIYFVASK